MSWEALIWAHKLRVKLTPAHYRVLMVLADHANKGDHIAYPSVATMAEEAELSDRSIQRALDELIRKNVILSLSGERRDFAGGRKATARYRLKVRLTIDAQLDDTPETPTNLEAAIGETPTFCPETPTFCPRNPVRMSPEPKTEPKTEPKKERVSDLTKNVKPLHPPSSSQKEPPEETEREGKGRPARDNSADILDALAEWNQVCGRAGLTKVIRLTPPRRLGLAKRMADEFSGAPDQWLRYLQRIVASPFLTGENERLWRADFDWAIKPANIVKVVEGKYDAQKAYDPYRGGVRGAL